MPSPGTRALVALTVAPSSDFSHASLSAIALGGGTLISRAQYLTDVGLYGYADARIKPRGNMSAEDCVYWTWAIANIK